MSLRVDQIQAVQNAPTSEESAPAARTSAKPLLAANPNPAWRRMSSAKAPAAGGALSAPGRVGTGFRTAQAPNRRAELAQANAKLQALHEIASRSVASVDIEHRDAIAAVFSHEIASHTAYRDSLV